MFHRFFIQENLHQVKYNGVGDYDVETMGYWQRGEMEQTERETMYGFKSDSFIKKHFILLNVKSSYRFHENTGWLIVALWGNSGQWKLAERKCDMSYFQHCDLFGNYSAIHSSSFIISALTQDEKMLDLWIFIQ